MAVLLDLDEDDDNQVASRLHHVSKHQSPPTKQCASSKQVTIATAEDDNLLKTHVPKLAAALICYPYASMQVISHVP
jgi:hypothetical protein